MRTSPSVARLDWRQIECSLETCGHATLPGLVSAPEAALLAAYYSQDARFRSTVVMARHGFGCGEYRYFDYPLPRLVQALRAQLYARLAPIADRWCEALGSRVRYPAAHPSYLARCRERGQSRATPLLLRYRAGDYNRLHQDLYGEEAFPFQVTVLLSEPERQFTGGEFLLTEQRPRMQTRAEVVPLKLGEAVVFAVRHRPARGARGIYRINVRHGVSRVRSGERLTMGIIFHDAA